MKKIKLTLYPSFPLHYQIHNIYTVSKNHKLNEKKLNLWKPITGSSKYQDYLPRIPNSNHLHQSLRSLDHSSTTHIPSVPFLIALQFVHVFRNSTTVFTV